MMTRANRPRSTPGSRCAARRRWDRPGTRSPSRPAVTHRRQPSRGRRARPYMVGSTPRRVRSRSRTPSVCSRPAMAADTTGCETEDGAPLSPCCPIARPRTAHAGSRSLRRRPMRSSHCMFAMAKSMGAIGISSFIPIARWTTVSIANRSAHSDTRPASRQEVVDEPIIRHAVISRRDVLGGARIIDRMRRPNRASAGALSRPQHSRDRAVRGRRSGRSGHVGFSLPELSRCSVRSSSSDRSREAEISGAREVARAEADGTRFSSRLAAISSSISS